MEFLKRLFGICRTQPPVDPDCWQSADGKLTIDLNRVPELSEPGGALRFEGPELPERVLVVHRGDGDYAAFRNRCTHMGRRIDPLPGTEHVQCCSVSKSTFDAGGTVISGPAGGPLTRYPTAVEDGRLVVTLGHPEP